MRQLLGPRGRGVPTSVPALRGRRRGPAGCEHELALLVAGTATRRRDAAHRIAELAAGVDECRLLATLARQRILLLVGCRLLEATPSTVSASFRADIDQALATARRRAMAFATVSATLTEAFEERGIPAVALKGGGLSQELYGDEALREYDDIDILVPRSRLGEAEAAAASLGWTIPHASGPDSPLHVALRHRGGAPRLDLHWRIHWYETRFAQQLIDRSRVLDGRRRLLPHDELASLLLYYARDGFAGLRLAADIAAWWDRHGSPGALAELERLSSEHPALAPAWWTSLAVARDVAGLPISAPDPRSRRQALARRLANWDLRGDPDQISANVTLVDGLLAPRDGLAAFARRRVAAAGVARPLARYAIALWRLRGGRAWSPVPTS